MTRWTIREWIAVNALAVAGAICAGSILASSQGRIVNVVRPDVVEAVRWSQSLAEIVAQNGRVWMFMFVGTVSFGAAGLSVLLSNGFRFGMDMAALILSAPTELRFLLPHGVLEFAALTVGAASCQYIGCVLFGTLTKDPAANPIREGVLAFGWSCVLGLMAALVETASHVMRLT